MTVHLDLLQAVSELREAALAFTLRLIAIPTENPPGNCYPEAAAFIREHLRELGFDSTEVGECVLSFVGEGERTVYFSGHYDVVPAESPGQFHPAIRGANLFGRGSSDMKSGLAAMTYAAKALRDAGKLRNGRIGLVFVPDEETAGPRGSRRLVERSLLGQNGIAMLTPEPTGGFVWNANRGAISLKLTVQGKTAHVGRQFAGVNAFEQMLSVSDALLKLKAEVERHETQFQIAPAAARKSILMLGGQAQSGSSFNAVPGSCSITVDRRINPEEDFEQEKRKLFAVIDAARRRGIDLDVEILQEGSSSGGRDDTTPAQALARSIRQVTGRDARFEMCPGLLEIRFYIERGIPALAYGPGLLSVSHGPDEFVPVHQMVRCAQVYALTAADLLA